MKPFLTIHVAMIGLLLALLAANWVRNRLDALIARWRDRHSMSTKEER